MITIHIQYPTNVHVVGTTSFPETAKEVINQLEARGYEVWATYD